VYEIPVAECGCSEVRGGVGSKISEWVMKRVRGRKQITQRIKTQ
jgi:hypothetical protein